MERVAGTIRLRRATRPGRVEGMEPAPPAAVWSRGHVRALLVVLLLHWPAALLLGQEAGDPPKELNRAPELVSPGEVSEELDLEQLERLRAALPRTLEKLRRRRDVYVAMVGDSVSNLFLWDRRSHDWVNAYPYRFLERVAQQFYMTGGVRLIDTHQERFQAQRAPFIGPEIVLDMRSRNGKAVIHAEQQISLLGVGARMAPGSEQKVVPDLVIINFGVNDSASGIDLPTYRAALQRSVEQVRGWGGEVILVAPNLYTNEPWISTLGITRPYASVMAEVAEELGVVFLDLGDLSWYVPVGPPEELGDEAFLDWVVEQLRSHYQHPDRIDWVHPSEEAHPLMARKMFERLIDGERGAGHELVGGSYQRDGDEIEVRVTLRNRGEEKSSFRVAPVAIRQIFRPEGGGRTVELAAGEATELVFRYSAAGVQAPLRAMRSRQSGEESSLRVPLVIAEEGGCWLPVVVCEALPFGLRWELGSQENVEGEFVVKGVIENPGEAPLRGSYVATWAGQEVRAEIECAGRGEKPLRLRFALPGGTGAAGEGTMGDELVFVLTTGDGKEHTSRRGLRATRNIGLGETVLLEPGEGTIAEAPAQVSMRVDADGQGGQNSGVLYFTFGVSGYDLVATPTMPVALTLDLNIDARGYGKRFEPGATDVLHFEFGVEDSTAIASSINPWTFGIGYGARYDTSVVRATLSTLPSGDRLVRVAIPRSYLYLHEWALGNANSQLGLNMMVNLLQITEDFPEGQYMLGTRFTFGLPDMHRDDSAAARAVELDSPASGRWRVKFF
jgi:lysophospholipase L1-like esterase